MVVIAKTFKIYFFSRNLSLFPKESTLFPQAKCPSPKGTWDLLHGNFIAPQGSCLFPKELFLLHGERAINLHLVFFYLRKLLSKGN